ncbi:MAG TPA: hypothetical protein VFL62_03520 [Bradyrhizobium sp.]|uniref:hypothetical protein n=1 Tax=Bradyrhizobium sp. TaxID=376 RepID=UPI002D7E3E96|nr:hypothetical protein [Bradyrhizobium sp.]HET7885276.1 hypothetical protein [Bradyrhizobium sp.]
MADRHSTPREIAELNIEHYSRLLQTTPEGPARASVEKLLAEEKAKLAALSPDRLRK